MKRYIVLTVSVVLLAAVGVGFSGPGSSATESMPVTTDPNIVADVVDEMGPGVVFIEVEYKEPVRDPRRDRDFPFRPPDDFFFPQPQEPRQPDPERMGSGTGFVISDEGHVLTNQHLFNNMEAIEEIRVTAVDRDEPIEAELIGSDFELDLAVLQIDTDDPLPVVPLGDSDQARVGEWAIAIGNPFGFEHTVTVGVVSAKGREIAIFDEERGSVREYRNLMQTDAAINPGNSGGPLLNLEGEVIGINTAVRTQAQGIGFAIPINVASEVVDELIDIGRIIRPFIGIQYGEVDDSISRSLGLEQADGIIIFDIVPDTAADDSDLRVGDVVTKVNRESISSIQDFLEAIEEMEVGDSLLLTVVREGRERLVNIEVGERPEELGR